MAASLGDLYLGAGHEDRLLTARSGALNVTQNMLPRSGYAEPLVAGLMGTQAAGIEQDQVQQAKVGRFLETFQKLAKVSKGAGVKFFNENAKEAGINTPIDGIDVQPDLTSVHFENGFVMGYGPGGIFKPNADGSGWDPVDQKYLDDFRKASVDTTKLKAQKKEPAPEKKSTLINSYRSIRQQQATMKANMGNTLAMNSTEYKKLEAQAAAMEEQYPWIIKENPTVIEPASSHAPTGSGIKIDPSKIKSGW